MSSSVSGNTVAMNAGHELGVSGSGVAGTGVPLAGIPASSGSTNERFGLNASGELCAGHGANDVNGYPSFSGSYPPDLCFVKQ